MFEKLFKYINDNLVLSDIRLRDDENGFVLKTITPIQIAKFNELKNKYKMNKWEISAFGLLTYWKGIDENGISEVKHNLVNKNNKNLPDSWLNFLRVFNGFCPKHFLLFGHNGYGHGPASIYFHRMTTFPKYIDKDFLNIGKYGGDKSPIFMSPNGEIYVYSGTFMFNPKNTGAIENQRKALIAYWDNIEDFITDETIRYIDMFIQEPYATATIEMLPNNITPEMLEKLCKEGKIKRP